MTGFHAFDWMELDHLIWAAVAVSMATMLAIDFIFGRCR